MRSKTSKIIVAGLGIVVLVSVILGISWVNRPIIAYNMREMPAYYTSSDGAPLNVTLSAINVGGVDASLKLIVTVTNAKITFGDFQQDIAQQNDTKIELSIESIRNREYVQKIGHVFPDNGTQNFTITYTIEDNSVLSPNGVISRLFLEKHPIYPTVAFYELDDLNNYRLVDS